MSKLLDRIRKLEQARQPANMEPAIQWQAQRTGLPRRLAAATENLINVQICTLIRLPTDRRILACLMAC